MKRIGQGLLALLALVGVLVVCPGYTRDVSGDGQKAILIALEALVGGTVVDDAAFTPGTTTVSMIGLQYDDTSPDSVNEGDGGAPRMSANRNQYMTVRDAAGNERGANVNASNQLAVVEASGSAIATDVAAAEVLLGHNSRGSAVTAVTKGTWTALSGIGTGTHRYLLVNCRSITSGNTATINVWCSPDAGTTWYKAVRADTLAATLAVSVACGTAVPGTPAGTTYYVDSLVIAVGPATHIFIEQDAVGTDNFVYEVGGL